MIPTKLSRITASSTEGVPKWVFLVNGNPGTEAWLVHAVDRQDKQPAAEPCRGIVSSGSRRSTQMTLLRLISLAHLLPQVSSVTTAGYQLVVLRLQVMGH